MATAAAQLLALAAWSDVLLLQRPNQSSALLRSVSAVNPRIVVDFDDALWVSAGGSQARSYAGRLTTAIELARVVVAGSDFLAAWASERATNGHVIVIRPSVDVAAVPHHTHVAGGSRVGWVGTAGNASEIERDVLPAVRRLRNVSLTVITSSMSSRDQHLNFVPWSLEEESCRIAELDVGVAPLGSDERSLGRCGLKTIQYMAAAVPPVVSPWGAGAEIVCDGVTGLHATGVEGWRHALETLLNDPPMRTRLGNAAREWVARNASLDVSARRLREALFEASQA
jgi:hypothetical protein